MKMLGFRVNSQFLRHLWCKKDGFIKAEGTGSLGRTTLGRSSWLNTFQVAREIKRA